MSQIKMLIPGTKFGKWEVLGNPSKKGHSTYWECQCECGNTQKVNGYTLRKGTSSQCTECKIKITLQSAELRIKRTETVRKKNGLTAAWNALLAQYQRNAKTRNLEFNLDKAYFFDLIQQDCHYCGSKPENIKWLWNRASGFVAYNGIDRKNNDLGYFKENCVTCCETCNKAKLTTGYEEFKSWIIKVYSHLKDNK